MKHANLASALKDARIPVTAGIPNTVSYYAKTGQDVAFYHVPWMLQRDNNGDLWLKDVEVQLFGRHADGPGGTAQMLVRVVNGEVHVNIPPDCLDSVYCGNQGVPVAGITFDHN